MIFSIKNNLLILLSCFFLIATAQEKQDSIVLGGNKIRAGANTFDSTATLPPKNDTLALGAKNKHAKADTIKRHSVKKAVLFSAILPGLGQAYNKKYWKIPIVYAGFGGLSYAVYYNATNYQQSRAAYRLAVDLDSTTTGSYKGRTDANSLKLYRDYYRKNLELSGLFMGIWYLLNLVDAAVDAHLFHYDVNDKLSINVRPTAVPTFQNNSPSFGLSLYFNLK